MTLPVRKSLRLPTFDYSGQNYYFVTICTAQKKCLFGTVEQLNACGILAQNELLAIPQHFPSVRVDKYVIMPNHIHAILVLGEAAPTLSTIVGLYKSGFSRRIGRGIWQRSFYDHVIWGQRDYETIWRYIDENPLRWQLDELYMV